MPQEQAEGIDNWNLSNKAISEHSFYNKNQTDGNTKPSDDLVKHTVGDLVYRLLNPKSNFSWKSFCTTLYVKTNADKWEDYINIEMIHNNLHVSLISLLYDIANSTRTSLVANLTRPVLVICPMFLSPHLIRCFTSIMRMLY